MGEGEECEWLTQNGSKNWLLLLFSLDPNIWKSATSTSASTSAFDRKIFEARRVWQWRRIDYWPLLMVGRRECKQTEGIQKKDESSWERKEKQSCIDLWCAYLIQRLQKIMHRRRPIKVSHPRQRLVWIVEPKKHMNIKYLFKFYMWNQYKIRFCCWFIGKNVDFMCSNSFGILYSKILLICFRWNNQNEIK